MKHATGTRRCNCSDMIGSGLTSPLLNIARLRAPRERGAAPLEGSLGNRSRARRAATRGSPRSVASSIPITSRRRSLDKRAKMRAESAVGALCPKTFWITGAPQALSGRVTNPESTSRLLDRARTGDQEAMDQLFRRYLKPLQRWAGGRLPGWARDLADTDDIVQDTLVQTFKTIDGFEPRRVGAFQAYLRQAVLNRIRDELRRKRRQPEMTDLDGLEVDRAASPARGGDWPRSGGSL